MPTLSLAGLNVTKYVKSSPGLLRALTPIANAFARAAGHRKVGLKYDDLIVEENPEMQKAISRLSERESYDRAFRLKQAIHLSALHRELPKEQWLKPEDDTRYISPILEEVQKENAEREAWDTVKVKKSGH